MKMIYSLAAAVAILSAPAMAAKPPSCYYLKVQGVQQEPVLVCGSIVSESNSKVDRNPRHKCHPPKSV
jgi:hypothetical protein